MQRLISVVGQGKAKEYLFAGGLESWRGPHDEYG
jgi:hypothetical protein